jgi:hypothetical protein
MVVTPDNSTLILAESYGHRLTAFDIDAAGLLSNRRMWADLGGYPDGICLNAENAVWYADVPARRCVRVREGGEMLQAIDLDRGCFACTLGGVDGRTLFLMAAEYPPAGGRKQHERARYSPLRRQHRASVGRSRGAAWTDARTVQAGERHFGACSSPVAMAARRRIADGGGPSSRRWRIKSAHSPEPH